ncbi:hypothetical protein VNI00_000209 [Paramarasmius palmivorus]|uniref:ER transporter 6TM N-terminal domain-containing protein n=1 Tax=Paramarasmius palmivorus TaxID=297713 RepID=A0AAW0EGB3_9AGAR
MSSSNEKPLRHSDTPTTSMQSEKDNQQTHTSGSPSSDSETKGEEPNTAGASTRQGGFQLPPWLLTNLKSPRSLKVFFRCWLASWVSFVIILPNASLRALGTSAFFSILTSFFLPPNMPVQFFLFMISTLVFGLLLGWGIGAAAMRAAVASRDPVLLQAATQQVQESIRSNPAFQANPVLGQTIAIFEGVFLDIRSSAVYGCFLGLGAFIFVYLAPLRSIYSAQSALCFRLLAITSSTSTLKSVACYIGIACITTIFVFPESMSHSYLSTTCEQLGRIKDLVALQDEVLRSSPAELGSSTNPIIAKTKGLRALIIGTQKQLLALSGFLSLEFSWGRFNSDDVRDLLEPMLGLTARAGEISDFYVYTLAQWDRQSHYKEAFAPISQTSSQSSARSTSNDTYLLLQINQLNLDLEAKAQRPYCRHTPAGGEIYAYFANCLNSDAEGSLTEAFDTSLDNLRKEIAKFKADDRLIILEPFLTIINGELSKPGRTSGPTSEPVSFLCLPCDDTCSTAMKRKRNRLWAPKGLRKIGNLLMQRDANDDGIAVTGEDASPLVAGIADEKQYRRDPDSAPPTNVAQKFMNSIHLLYHWTKTAEAMFTFKYVIITIALWIPGVLRSTANFYYVQKGLWALIMAQTTMNIYASDQIFNLFTRLLGTVVGLIFGLAAWYMGNGHGNGNPYGAAASMAFWCIPLVFLRLYAPPQYLTGLLLACATFALIMGYSWVDGNLQSYGSPGIGWNVAWRRFVLVAIGSGASFIIMMLPPQSGRKAVRRRNAALISAISNLYGFLVATWISGDKASFRDTDDSDSEADEQRLLSLGDEVNAIRGLTELAKWEGNARGKWPAAEYSSLVETEAEMMTPLAQLGGALLQMDDEWRLSLAISQDG